MTTYPSQVTKASDDALLEAGNRACALVKDAIAEGKRDVDAIDGVSIIDGETKSDTGYYMDSSTIFAGAQLNLCPETIG